MSLIEQLEKGSNFTSTENGAKTNKSALDPVLDFFSLAGAMRDRPDEAVKLFKKAHASDQQMAIRCLFYLRDIRGGQGERKTFRAIIDSLDGNTVEKIAQWIPEYGRWDEVPLVESTIGLIKKQLGEDEANMKAEKSVSLLAKWLPSENTSSKKTTQNAKRLSHFLGLKPHQYRKKIVALRKYIKLLEQKMSSKEWDSIDYEKLPSQAHRKHTKAFKRNDEKRYTEYLEGVEKGEKKINSGTLYTYEIFDMVDARDANETTLRTADAMWNALPDYTDDTNALVMADVSGSMTGRPMSISVSLALYFAERNKGTFAGYYMTFSDHPLLQKVNGLTIKDKFEFIESTNVGYNTNLHAGFRAILNATVADRTEQKDVPKVLYIISDMEFDDQMSDCSETNFETAQREFSEKGYQLPHVVFWNVNARNNQAPATKYDSRVTLISGSSQSTFQYAIAGKTPLESMNDILNSERYAQIII